VFKARGWEGADRVGIKREKRAENGTFWVFGGREGEGGKKGAGGRSTHVKHACLGMF